MGVQPDDTVRSYQRRISRFLVPSFLSANRPKEIVRPTDFLDGLRGFAALFVFNYHCIAPLYPQYRVGFWSNGGDEHDSWLTQLPIIRCFYNGPVCVLLFFVLSGFSITLKPLKLARQGQHEALFNTLVSATFRRACRLYMPCLALLVMVLCLIYLGLFNNALVQSQSPPFIGKHFPQPTVMQSGQFRDFLAHIWVWSDPLNPATRPMYMPYSGQLWTIPVELRCSLITWMVVTGLAKTRPTLRMTLTAAFAVYFFARNHIHPALFVAGAVLAELYLVRAASSKPSVEPQAKKSPFDHLDRAQALPKTSGETQSQQIKYGAIFASGLFLCSFPAVGGAKALGWPLLCDIAAFFMGRDKEGNPPPTLFTCVGSVLIVYGVSQSALLQRPFSTPLAKYLGKISYSLYCVHQPLLNMFGFMNFKFWWELGLGHNLGFLIAFTIQLAFTVLASDMFYRAIDEPSVRFAKWVEEQMAER